jgi:hypothetical protein
MSLRPRAQRDTSCFDRQMAALQAHISFLVSDSDTQRSLFFSNHHFVILRVLL